MLNTKTINVDVRIFCLSRLCLSLIALISNVIMATPTLSQQSQGVKPTRGDSQVKIVISGGHETDQRDRGRPVALIAAALKVPEEVFREAFTHVHPAPPGQRPDEERARQNKDALLLALGKYGVTNERLDEVSNHYRYQRSRGELWPTKDAEAMATIHQGVVTAITMSNGGNGYSSAPDITIPGYPTAKATATLKFGANFEDNGSIQKISIEHH